jgi:hypothetical protein
MGKHFSQAELDTMQAWKVAGTKTLVIHARLKRARQKMRPSQPGPDLTSTRRALKGKTFKRSRVETRGGARILSPVNLDALDRARKRLIAKADGEYEVRWGDVIGAARVPHVDRSTAAKSMNRAGYDVKWRHPRLKPSRGDIDEAQRKRICNKLRKLPQKFWLKSVDLYMDNKKWPCPRSVKSRKHLSRLRVRGHLRKKSEGLKKGFTKPDARKHRANTGGQVNVCAGIINGKIKIWHYLPARWCADAAVQLYKNVVAPALRRHRGNKRKRCRCRT